MRPKDRTHQTRGATGYGGDWEPPHYGLVFTVLTGFKSMKLTFLRGCPGLRLLYKVHGGQSDGKTWSSSSRNFQSNMRVTWEKKLATI